MNIKIKCVVASIILLSSLSSAHAAVVTWTLDGVRFDDGATAVGSFDYDASTSLYSNVNIAVTTGTLSAYDYIDEGIFIGMNDASMVDFVDNDFERFLRFTFDSPLDDAGGMRNLVLANMSFECTNCNEFRFVTAGTLSASPIPLPAAVWLFASALAGLGFSTRKKPA